MSNDPNNDAAKTSPASRYASPWDVLEDDVLTREEKLKVLRDWEVDARELQRAEAENMAGGESNQLHDVRRAMDKLSAGDSDVADPSNRQGALG